jgi:hypothetical protein
MPDPFANDDIVKSVPVGPTDGTFVLTLYFNGGPVPVTVKQFDPTSALFPDDPPKIATFIADPFFRKPNYYVTTGSLQFRFFPGGPTPKVVLVSVLFTNMFAPGIMPGPAHFRIQLTSPLNPAPRTWDQAGDVPPGGTQNVVIAIGP